MPIGLAPKYLPLNWLPQHKASSLFLSAELHSAIGTHLHVEVFRKSKRQGFGPYSSFDLQFPICEVLFILESGKAFKH